MPTQSRTTETKKTATTFNPLFLAFRTTVYNRIDMELVTKRMGTATVVVQGRSLARYFNMKRKNDETSHAVRTFETSAECRNANTEAYKRAIVQSVNG